MTDLVRGPGRPSKYGRAMSSSERNIERRAKMMAVMDAAEVWARFYMSGVSREDFMAAQARLSEAVRAWRAYRGQV